MLSRAADVVQVGTFFVAMVLAALKYDRVQQPPEALVAGLLLALVAGVALSALGIVLRLSSGETFREDRGLRSSKCLWAGTVSFIVGAAILAFL
ncbi:hypothetical protein [Spirillospora sp. NPDC047279]|uniref:hypothetical protein n=1 Tax=Spirillospora sp. NPDC047279 TaxID=3155478 RepID=UPI0033D52A5C